MIELATAATAAALLNNSVSAVDKVYNWWKTLHGGAPAAQVLRSDPQTQVLEYVALDGSKHVVMSYQELAQRLNPDDFNFIKSFEMRMKTAMVQWEALNSRLPLADPVERARIEANMEQMKERDICVCLKQIVDFIEKLQIDLHDHYASVRAICQA